MNTQNFRLPVLFFIIGLAAVSPTNADVSLARTLPEYLDRVRAHDAWIAEARLRWEAVEASVPAAGALPDPELTYGYFFEPIETRVGPQNQKFGLSQKIPWPGRLAEERTLAEAGVEVAYFDYLHTVRQRMARAKSAWLTLAAAEARLRILDEQIELVREALSTLEGTLASDRSELSDSLLMRQRLSRLEARRLDIAGAREAAAAEVRRFAGQKEAVVPGRFEALELPTLPERDSLKAALIANSERLKARTRGVERAQRALAVARLEEYPDITVGFDYTQISDNSFSDPPNNGRDAVMGFVRISLPIWRDKYRAVKMSAAKELSAARARKRATEDDLVEQVLQTYARAGALRRQIRLYEERLLPESRETFEATLAGFQTGRTGALHWIEAQRGLLDAEMGRLLLEADYLDAAIELERLSAVELVREQPTEVPHE